MCLKCIVAIFVMITVSEPSGNAYNNNSQENISQQYVFIKQYGLTALAKLFMDQLNILLHLG